MLSWRAAALNLKMRGGIMLLALIAIMMLSLLSRQSTFLRVTMPSGVVEPGKSWNVDRLKIFVADLPRELNYGLLEEYWSAKAGEFLPQGEFLRTPGEPLWRQHNAEYWLLADLLTPAQLRAHSVAERVLDPVQADVIFVPFFATLSAKMQLAKSRGRFRHKKDNQDYMRQRRAVDVIKNSTLWQRSAGIDHVFVLTDPVAMYHVRSEIASSLLLLVDFGGWYKEDAKAREGGLGGDELILHTQVSLLKDVIVPHTHLLPTLNKSEDRHRDTLLYFKGARHRHRTGLVRDKLWQVLEGESGVTLEEGSPDDEGLDEAMTGMRRSHFCLNPAGDTPSSCRLYDAIVSACIPVIVSDTIELPFEGMLDYTEFCIFISVGDALQPGLLVNRLHRMSDGKRKEMRARLFEVQHKFEYDNGYPGGRGPMVEDGAVNHIWKKIMHKVPGIQEARTRLNRIPPNAILPARCHCV